MSKRTKIVEAVVETSVIETIPHSRRFYNLLGRVGLAILSTIALINFPDITDIPKIIILILFHLGSNLDLFKKSAKKAVRIAKIMFGIILCLISVVLFRETQDIFSFSFAITGFVSLLSSVE
jgi:hypothetical protein